MRGPNKIRQSDLTKVFKSARAAGAKIVRLQIGKDVMIDVMVAPAETIAEESHNDFEHLKKHAEI
jgi:hypothetical protein